MSRAGAGVIVAALLALAGCRSTDKDDKLTSKGKAKDGAAAKGPNGATAKGPTWLDDGGKLPGAGTGIPKGTGFDPKSAAQDTLGGRVLDPDGRPARNIFVRIEPVGAAAGGQADLGIYTKNDGYFSANGFKPGQTYELTAEATTQDGRRLTGVVQTRVPNPILLILLRDDLAPGGTFPPTPKPSDKVSEPAPPKDGAWAPGTGSTGVPPATIGAPPPGGTPKPPAGTGAVPPPADISFPPADKPPVKPENVADGPKDKNKPPPVNIPGPYSPPPVPPLPSLPSFGPPPGGRSSSAGTGDTQVALVDALNRPWGLDALKPGSLVLLEFSTTTCSHCPKVLPVLKEMQSRYGASGLQVVGVLCDDVPQKARVARAAKYAGDHDLNYAMYVEPGDAGGVRDAFNVEAYPHAILLNSGGKVLWRGHPGDRAELESAVRRHLAK